MNILVLTSCFIWIAKTYAILTWLFKPPVHKKGHSQVESSQTCGWNIFSLAFRIYLKKVVFYSAKTKIPLLVILLQRHWPWSWRCASSNIFTLSGFLCLVVFKEYYWNRSLYYISCIERILGYRYYLVSLESRTADF